MCKNLQTCSNMSVSGGEKSQEVEVGNFTTTLNGESGSYGDVFVG